MTEPCRALMGYVPGRYVEGGTPYVAPRPVCLWCGVLLAAGVTGVTCSESCGKALVRKRKGWRERR